MKKRNFKSTKHACYTGYIVQAVINNIAPLLFVIFSTQFNISFERLSILITVNFVTQMIIDISSVKFIDKIGYRILSVSSQFITFLGLALMAILPNIMKNSFVGIVISIMFCAIGSGLTEVIISPIVESIPGDKKTSEMSLLHSFYCWGQVFVVIVTTLLIKAFGEQYWYIVPAIWSIIPFANSLNFTTVPLAKTLTKEEKTPLKKMLFSYEFIFAMIIMICAGASEIAMSQWSSYFAETGLKISKVTGDLLGPCLFAIFMGIGRTFFGFYGEKIKIKTALTICSSICIACYIGASLSKLPLLSLLYCALTGLGVSIMWPATFSLSARMFPKGGGSMFGVMALAGDLGCTLGPWLVSYISVLYSNSLSEGDALKKGLGYGAIFPIIMVISVIMLGIKEKFVDKKSNNDIINT